MTPRHTLLPTVFLGLLALTLGGPAGGAHAEEGVGPRLRTDRLEHNFGQVAQEQELETTFTYENAGDARLVGIRAIGDCGCYGVSLTKEELEPGETGALKVKFRTLRFNGKLSKRLQITTQNGERQPLKIKLIVNVISGVILSPGRIWFGDVLLGSSPVKTVYAKWHEEAGKPFKITGVEVPGYEFGIEKNPYEQGPWKGTAITFSFQDAPPLGMFSATALLRTTDPDHPRISLPVTAHVTGKVWVQSRTVYFGWIQKGQSKKTQILVRPFSPDVDLGTVTASSRDAKVTIVVEKHPMGREGWWRLVVTVPSDTPVGQFDDVVVIHSAVTGEEETEIEIRGEVLDVGR